MSEVIKFNIEPKIMSEPDYIRMSEMYDFLGLVYDIEYGKKDFPFNWHGKGAVEFSWPTIIIPSKGINRMVQAKIAGDKTFKYPRELDFLIQIPFIQTRQGEPSVGVIHKNISVGFQGGKEYKYGDVNNHVAELAYFLEYHGEKTNDYIILHSEVGMEFITKFIMNNQWGKGATVTTSDPQESMDGMYRAAKSMQKKRRAHQCALSYADYQKAMEVPEDERTYKHAEAINRFNLNYREGGGQVAEEKPEGVEEDQRLIGDDDNSLPKSDLTRDAIQDSEFDEVKKDE